MDSETPSAATDLPGLRPPRQARSRRTLERLVQAALELMGEKGVGGTSVQEIVDRAGSSVGSFYARFQGKQDLVDYLRVRVWDEALERWRAVRTQAPWDDLSTPEVIEASVRLIAQVEGIHPRARAVLGEDSPAAVAFRSELHRDLAAILEAREPTLSHPDPAEAIRVLIRVVAAAARAHHAEAPGVVSTDGTLDRAGDGSAGRGDRATFTAELVRMAQAYLTGDGPAATGAEEVEFFDVWG